MLLLLAVAINGCTSRHHLQKETALLVGESQEDVRDNVFNYDEQGGGEEDEVRPSLYLKDPPERQHISLPYVNSQDHTGHFSNLSQTKICSIVYNVYIEFLVGTPPPPPRGKKESLFCGRP